MKENPPHASDTLMEDDHAYDKDLVNTAADTLSSNGSIDLSSTFAMTPNQFENLSLQDSFSCLFPVNPHMRTKEARLQTFLDNSSIWPAHRIRATPQQIVDAGMYYLGERDRVKCWYCNGGLQNWERDDNPWEGHAKWFPLCEYVLQQKGLDYVQEVVSKFPGLQRPNFYRATSSSAVDVLREQLRSPPSSPPGSPAPVIDPQKELRERKAQVNEEMENSEFVQMAKFMGFSEKQIYAALIKNYKNIGGPFTDFPSMVDALMETSNDNEEPSSGTVETNYDEATTKLLELRQLEKSQRCKICRNCDIRVIFLPCGHFSSCVKCAQNCEKCPVCEETIQEKIQTNLNTGKTF